MCFHRQLRLTRERERCTGATSPIPLRRSAAQEWAHTGMEDFVGAGALARERQCCAGGSCVRTGLRAGGSGRLLQEVAHAALQRARHTLPKLFTSACLHHAARTPPPPQSHTSLPAPLEGDLPSFPARSTSACVALGLVHARGASSVEASGVHALRRRRTALSCRHRGRGRCGGPTRRGG
jgi:hypothetical protein